MNAIWQWIGASGILLTILTLIITKIVNNLSDQLKKLQQTKTDNDFLLWTKIDKMGDMMVLMANKLHEAGIINGDLEGLKQEYRQADAKYNDNVRRLAAEVLRK